MMKKLIAILSAIIICLSSVAFASNLSNLKDKLEDINNSVDEKKDELDDIKKEQKTVLASIEVLNKEINTLEDDIDKLESDLSTLNKEITQKNEELKIAEEEMKKQDELLKARVVVMYESGDTSMIDVLISSDNLVDFLSKYYLLSQITEFDTELLNEMKQKREEIEQMKISLQEKKDSVASKKASKESKNKTLSVSKTQLSSKNAELAKNAAAINEAIDKLLKESNAIESEIRKLQSNGAYVGGVMAWPLPGYSTITSPYGMRVHPVLKTYKMHTGVDIAGSGCYGASIVSANAGTVITAKYNTAYGNMIIVDHGGGTATLYAHASKLLVSVGQKVSRGQAIAKVGSTGYSTGPHLHFEVRINGATVDPMKYIKK